MSKLASYSSSGAGEVELSRLAVELVGGLLEVLHEVGHIVVVIPRARFTPREVARDLLELVQVFLPQLVDDAREQVLQLCCGVVLCVGRR